MLIDIRSGVDAAGNKTTGDTRNTQHNNDNAEQYKTEEMCEKVNQIADGGRDITLAPDIQPDDHIQEQTSEYVQVPIPANGSIDVTKHDDPAEEDRQAMRQLSQELRRKPVSDYVIAVTVMVLLVGYLIVVPYIITSLYYISWIQSIESGICSLCIPFILFANEYLHYKGDKQSYIRAWSRFSKRSGHAVTNSSKQWIYEFYQLLLTLLSVCLWLSYTYYLSFIQLDDDTYRYVSTMPQRSIYVQCELFVVFGIGIDVILRYVVTVSRRVFFTNIYNLLDILVVTSIVYFGYYYLDILGESVTTYNLYLIGGFLRFVRIRRALLEVNHAIVINGKTVHRLGPLLLSNYAATAIMLCGRLLIYLFATAALIEAFEFPCIAVVAADAQCFSSFQQFHEVVYFVTVTLATVGYGDMSPSTSAGRVIMIAIIIIAVLDVPVLVNDFSTLAREDQQEREKQAENEGSTRRSEQEDSHIDHDDNNDLEQRSQTDIHSGSSLQQVGGKPSQHSEYDTHMTYLAVTYLSQRIQQQHTEKQIKDICKKLDIDVKPDKGDAASQLLKRLANVS